MINTGEVKRRTATGVMDDEEVTCYANDTRFSLYRANCELETARHDYGPFYQLMENRAREGLTHDQGHKRAAYG